MSLDEASLGLISKLKGLINFKVTDKIYFHILSKEEIL